MQTKNRNSRSITRKYLPIRVGKREPLLEELLDEGRIRFEGQRRYLLELHEFGVERRRIDHDLHAHQNRTPCLSLIHNCQIRKTLQRIEARRSSISRFNAGFGFLRGKKAGETPDPSGIGGPVIGEREKGRESWGKFLSEMDAIEEENERDS